MTIHTFEVTCTVPGDEYYFIQEKLKNADPSKWAKASNGMIYWGLSDKGILIKMFITRKKDYFTYNIIYRISARRVINNDDFVGLFDTDDYEELAGGDDEDN